MTVGMNAPSCWCIAYDSAAATAWLIESSLVLPLEGIAALSSDELVLAVGAAVGVHRGVETDEDAIAAAAVAAAGSYTLYAKLEY